MTDTEQTAILDLCLQAALADGNASATERSALRQLAERLQQPGSAAALSDQDLRARTRSVHDLARELRAPESARMAYEMAVAICQADEALNPAEQWFLEELRRELALDAKAVQEVQQQAEAIAGASVTTPIPAAAFVAAPPVVGSPAVLPPTPREVVSTVSDAELDRTILNNSILAGALELLPDTLATMAIVPVQMRLVYQIGKAHGYELDRGHIKDLLATVGVGLASQMVESFAERAVRGLLGKFAGGMVRGLAGQLTSSGMSFATTYALGQLARQYYAGGRRFSAIELRSLYDSLVGQGRSLQTSYLPQIREQAGRVNLGSLTSMLRGKG